MNRLGDLGGRLQSLDLSGNLSGLAPTIERDPEVTRLALEAARSELDPVFEDNLMAIRNEAAANNQLQSSTFTDALAREAGRTNRAFQGITADAALQDRVRALQNRIGLLNIGVGATSQAGSFALANQAAKNQFNQQDFENQLSLATMNKKDSGVGRALSGAISGAMVGGQAGGVYGAIAGAGIGGAAGYFGGESGSSGANEGITQLFSRGRPSMGGDALSMGGRLTGYQPRSSASNNPFGRISGAFGNTRNNSFLMR